MVAVSTIDGAIHDPAGLDLPSLLDLLRDHGSRFVHSTKAPRITQAALLELPVDVLIPAAGPWTINPDNVGKVQATMIVPAANIPIAPAAAKQLIRKADVLPDFVCNSGGVLGSFLEKKGFDPATVRTKLMEDFRAIVKDLIITGQINNPPYGALKDITWVK